MILGKKDEYNVMFFVTAQSFFRSNLSVLLHRVSVLLRDFSMH